jgi:transposase
VKQLLFVGDDWAEDHHDVEVMDAAGRRLSAAKLPEGIAGMARFHAMIAAQLDPDADLDAQAGQVLIGIETDRGPWVQALIAAGYRVYAVNPLQAARYRERLGVSGAKVIRRTLICSRTWSGPTPTSCGSWPVTPTWPRRSRWSPGRTRR